MSAIVDVAFPLFGGDRSVTGYHVYAAISRVRPELHGAEWLAIHPPRPLAVTLRLPTDRLEAALPLAGARTGVGTLGDPVVRTLRPRQTLSTDLVVIKLTRGVSEVSFAAELRRQLCALGVTTEPRIGRAGWLRIKRFVVRGWAVTLSGLAPDESLAVQSSGLGGKRRMGCGVFV